MDLKIELLRQRLEVWEEKIADEAFVQPFSDLIGDYKILTSCLEEELKEIERLESQIGKTEKKDARRLLEKVLFQKIHFLGETMERCLEYDWVYIGTAERQYREKADHRFVFVLVENASPSLPVAIIPCGYGPYSSLFTEFADISTETPPRVIIFYPYGDLKFPMMLPLLFHEVGHVGLRYSGEENVFGPLTSDVQAMRRDVEFDLDRSRGTARETRIKSKWNAFVEYWRYWRQELYSDIFALSISGPCYFHALLHHDYGRHPYEVYWEHPPFRVRIENLEVAASASGLGDPYVKKEFDIITNAEESLGFSPSKKYSENAKERMIERVRELSSTAIREEYGENVLDESWWLECMSRLERYRNGNDTNQSIVGLLNSAWIDFFEGTSFPEANKRLRRILIKAAENQTG